MKRYSKILAALLAVLVLCGCAKGNVDNVSRTIGDSVLYTDAEIGRAMDVETDFFKKNFQGCTLTEIVYDEAFSVKRGALEAQQFGAEEAIVLLSSFDVDASGGEGNLEPNSTYTRYQWTLTRSKGGKWILQTWGYG